MCTHLSHSILHTRQDVQIQWTHCSHYGKVVVPRLLSQGSRCRSQLKCFQRWFCSLAALAVQSQSIEWRPWLYNWTAQHLQRWYVICPLSLGQNFFFVGSNLSHHWFYQIISSPLTWKIMSEQVSQNHQLAIACHSHIHSTSGHIPSHGDRLCPATWAFRCRLGGHTAQRHFWSAVEGPGTRGFAVCWWWYPLVI